MSFVYNYYHWFRITKNLAFFYVLFANLYKFSHFPKFKHVSFYQFCLVFANICAADTVSHWLFGWRVKMVHFLLCFEQQQHVSLLLVLQQHKVHLHSEPHWFVAHLQSKFWCKENKQKYLNIKETNQLKMKMTIFHRKNSCLPLQQSHGILSLIDIVFVVF